MEIKTLRVSGIYESIFGMRNPKNSWSLSDSIIFDRCDPTREMVDHRFIDEVKNSNDVLLGEKDLKLAQNLIKAGNEHMKFMRMIQVWCDMNMTRFFWSEYDTYRFNTKNSCSTMHTIMQRPITFEDFGLDEELLKLVSHNAKSDNSTRIVPINLPKGIKEEWVDIKGFEGRYKISNKGEIVRYAVTDVYKSGKIINRGEKIIKPSISGNGYLKVGLNKDSKFYNKNLHRLLAEHFIPNPDNLPCVNHIDGNKLNNNLDNLEWCTAKYNSKHSFDNGMSNISEYSKYKVSNVSRRFTSKEIKEIRKLFNEGKTKKEISKIFNCCDSIIGNILNDKTYKNIEDYEYLQTLEVIIDRLNLIRTQYINSNNNEEKIKLKRRFKCLLPEGFLQLRTVNTNYAEIRNIVLQRNKHQMKKDWQDTFCKWATTLPYAKELIFCGIEDIYNRLVGDK